MEKTLITSNYKGSKLLYMDDVNFKNIRITKDGRHLEYTEDFSQGQSQFYFETKEMKKYRLKCARLIYYQLNKEKINAKKRDNRIHKELMI